MAYLPGRAVHRAAGAYRGQGKTDARDAAVIADQARMRRDLAAVAARRRGGRELKLLTARRVDPVADRTRVINRLRGRSRRSSPPWTRTRGLTANRGRWSC